MKKIFVFLISIFSILGLFSLNVNAESIEYKNIITDESTIEEDFNVLKMDINNYYINNKILNNKWYVVAISESYISDTQVQTYFYIYNCKSLYGVEFINIDYSINYVKSSFNPDGILSSIASNGLYKVKGFVYNFTSSDFIKITKINGDIYTADGLDSKINDVNFETTINHSKINNKFNMEFTFNSFLLINEYISCSVKLTTDDYMYSYLVGLLNPLGEFTECDLVFYNFNFPNNIKPDEVLKADFLFDEIYYFKNKSNNITKIKEYKDLIHTYTPETQLLQVNDYSTEFLFDTFVLGNRIEKGEFGDLKFTDDEKKLFAYDCSILLDCLSTKTKFSTSLGPLGNIVMSSEQWYYEIDNIHFIEFQYLKDGVVYTCDVVAPPVENDDIVDILPDKEKNMWELFVEWFIDNFPMSIAYIGLLLALIIVGISLLPMMIPYIPKILITLFKVIKWLILLPFKTIKFIFNLFKRFFKTFRKRKPIKYD